MQILPADDYQPAAHRAFEEARAALAAALPRERIEHIGSSAIPGAHSKGDVDICVCVAQEDFAEALSHIQRLGYVVKADTLRTEQLCMLESPRKDISLAVQLIERGSEFEFFFAFRDALMSDPALVEQYNQLKHRAAGLGEDGYRAEKARFIRQVLDGLPGALDARAGVEQKKSGSDGGTR